MDYVRRDRNNESFEQSQFDKKNYYQQRNKGINLTIQKEDEKQF